MDNGDGTYENNGWFQDRDGTWYYASRSGYILQNTTTPDGYPVNADGAWIQAGGAQDAVTAVQLDEAVQTFLGSIAGNLFDDYYYNHDLTTNFHAERTTLTEEQKAGVAYWYIYFHGGKDARIIKADKYGETVKTKAEDVSNIIGELTGDYSGAALGTFQNQYAEKAENGFLYVSATGNFGDAGSSYLEQADEVTKDQAGQLILKGSVVSWNHAAGTYVPVKTYTAVFTSGGGTAESGGYLFQSLTMEWGSILRVSGKSFTTYKTCDTILI